MDRRVVVERKKESQMGNRGGGSRILKRRRNLKELVVGDQIQSLFFSSMDFRNTLSQALSLGVTVATALIMWKALMCISGCESPAVVVLTGSMEPGFSRGDLLFLHMSNGPIRAGEIVVFNIKEREIPIVHRVIRVHEGYDTEENYFLTKGDSNHIDDRVLYSRGQDWLQREHIMGRAVGYLPYVGYMTIIMTEKPVIKYILLGTLGLLLIIAKN